MRIRTIKPEFWEDDKVGPMSMGARLAFLWCLNAADDDGRLANLNPARVRAGVFMYHDDVTLADVAGMLRELTASGRVRPYEVDGQSYAVIPRFREHQVINRPTSSRIPEPPAVDTTTHGGLTEDSVSAHGGLSECSRRTPGGLLEGKERKGKERIISVATQPHPSAPVGGDLGAADSDQEKGNNEGKAQERDTPTRRVFAHWQQVMGHPGAKLDPKRTGAIRRALHLGYTEQALIRAIDGCRLTPYNMGDNDQGRKYDALDLILRDAEHIDRFIAHADHPPRPRGKVHPESITAQREREANRPRAPVITYTPKPRQPDDPF